MISELSKLIPTSLQNRSGKVFYSGREAFSGASPLYVLGVNPGGTPSEYASETVEAHTRMVLRSLPSDWSAYRDESWGGKAPGTAGMQPRILHLFRVLGVSAGEVPASNLVFARSSRESTFEGDMLQMARECWPFHERAIQLLSAKVIVCLGTTAGDLVRARLGASNQIDHFVEKNKRRWTSRLFSSGSGVAVAVLTHPSIANWAAAASDPTCLVSTALDNTT
jgi:hypothetical protein